MGLSFALSLGQAMAVQGKEMMCHQDIERVHPADKLKLWLKISN